MINVCEKINCPFNKKTGCGRYVISNQCHLLQGSKKGSEFYLRNKPLFSGQVLEIEVNQYWLFTKDDISNNIFKELKEENKVFLSTDEHYKKREKFLIR